MIITTLKVSFDFDGTLSQDSIQEFAKHLLAVGDEVWVVTSRVSNPEKWNLDLFSVAEDVGISRNNIFFTEGDYKWKFLDTHDFDIHFDDDYMEVNNIISNCKKCKAIQVYDTFQDE